jgi:outer membrane receptor protein involved in Fe transport
LHLDQNTCYVALTFQPAPGGLTLSAPASANFAPPGYYMLFLVNGAGVPSIAPFIQLQ